MQYYLEQANITSEAVQKLLTCWIGLSLKPNKWNIINLLATYNFQKSRLCSSESIWRAFLKHGVILKSKESDEMQMDDWKYFSGCPELASLPRN